MDRLLQDAGIIRHGGKIRSTINNAARAIEMVEQEGSLGRWFWSWEPKADGRSSPVTRAIAQTPHTDISTALSKQLKKRGWSFVGPTTCYAFMQAMGMVNDHIEGCYCRDRIEQQRVSFKTPLSNRFQRVLLPSALGQNCDRNAAKDENRKQGQSQR